VRIRQPERQFVHESGSTPLLTDGHYVFVYDEDGNLIRKGSKFTLSGEAVSFTTDGKGVEYWEYTYNLRNQLTQVHKNGHLVATYAYDGLGLRVSATTTITSKTTGQAKTTTRDYLFDLADRVIYDQVISTAGSLPSAEGPETSTENSYIFAGGTHFAKVEGPIGSTAELYYYHNDHLGSPMAITDSQGNLAWSQDYLPYGEALNEAATQTKTRFTFTGKELDPATGLYYNARWYDPDLGRFMTEDPGKHGDNWHSYANANPLRYLDPNGRTPVDAYDIIVKYEPVIQRVANKYDVPEELIKAVIYKENEVRNILHSVKDLAGILIKGEASLGITQMGMETAAFLDKGIPPEAHAQLTYEEREAQKKASLASMDRIQRFELAMELMNPEKNIEYCARYLDYLRDARGGYSDMEVWLSDYNRGLTFESGPSDYGDDYWEIKETVEAWETVDEYEYGDDEW
jgi:RHS repeat-associated protein